MKRPKSGVLQGDASDLQPIDALDLHQVRAAHSRIDRVVVVVLPPVSTGSVNDAGARDGDVAAADREDEGHAYNHKQAVISERSLGVVHKQRQIAWEVTAALGVGVIVVTDGGKNCKHKQSVKKSCS